MLSGGYWWDDPRWDVFLDLDQRFLPYLYSVFVVYEKQEVMPHPGKSRWTMVG